MSGAVILWFFVALPTTECLESWKKSGDELVTVQYQVAGSTMNATVPRRVVSGQVPPEPKPILDQRFGAEPPKFEDPAGCYNVSVYKLEPDRAATKRAKASRK